MVLGYTLLSVIRFLVFRDVLNIQIVIVIQTAIAVIRELGSSACYFSLFCRIPMMMMTMVATTGFPLHQHTQVMTRRTTNATTYSTVPCDRVNR